MTQRLFITEMVAIVKYWHELEGTAYQMRKAD